MKKGDYTLSRAAQALDAQQEQYDRKAEEVTKLETDLARAKEDLALYARLRDDAKEELVELALKTQSEEGKTK